MNTNKSFSIKRSDALIKEMNISKYLLNDIEGLRSLLKSEGEFLEFSYYSGFFIAALNSVTFFIALRLYIQVQNGMK